MKKVNAYLFYKDKKTEIEEFEYQTEYHLENYIVLALMMCDEKLRNPECVVLTVNGKYHSHSQYGKTENKVKP